MASASEEQFGDYLATLKMKLDHAAGTASALRSEFSEKMQERMAFLNGFLNGSL